MGTYEHITKVGVEYKKENRREVKALFQKEFSLELFGVVDLVNFSEFELEGDIDLPVVFLRKLKDVAKVIKRTVWVTTEEDDNYYWEKGEGDES